MNRVRRAVRDERGFALLELMVASILTLVIAAAAFGVVVSSIRTERRQFARVQALDDARGAMNRLTKEVRQALSVATTSTQSSLDMQTLISGVQHRIVYDVSGGTLRRSVDGGAVVPMVGGLGSSGSSATTPRTVSWRPRPPPGIALVRVVMSVTPSVSGAGPIVLTTDVRLRNSSA